MDLDQLLATCDATSAEKACSARDLKRASSALAAIPTPDLEKHLFQVAASSPHVKRLRRQSRDESPEYAYYISKQPPSETPNSTASTSTTSSASSVLSAAADVVRESPDPPLQSASNGSTSSSASTASNLGNVSGSSMPQTAPLTNGAAPSGVPAAGSSNAGGFVSVKQPQPISGSLAARRSSFEPVSRQILGAKDIISALHALCAENEETAVPIDNVYLYLRDRMRALPQHISKEHLLQQLTQSCGSVMSTGDRPPRFYLGAKSSPSGSDSGEGKPSRRPSLVVGTKAQTQPQAGQVSPPSMIPTGHMMIGPSAVASHAQSNMSSSGTPGNSTGGGGLSVNVNGEGAVYGSTETWSVPPIPFLKHYSVLSKTGRISLHPWRAGSDSNHPEDAEWYKTSVYTLSARLEFAPGHSPPVATASTSPTNHQPNGGGQIIADVMLVHSADHSIVDEGLTLQKAGPFVITPRGSDVCQGEIGPFSPAKFSFRHNYKDGDHPRFRLRLTFRIPGDHIEYESFSPAFLVKSKKPKRNGGPPSPMQTTPEQQSAGTPGMMIPHLSMPPGMFAGAPGMMMMPMGGFQPMQGYSMMMPMMPTPAGQMNDGMMDSGRDVNSISGMKRAHVDDDEGSPESDAIKMMRTAGGMIRSNSANLIRSKEQSAE